MKNILLRLRPLLLIAVFLTLSGCEEEYTETNGGTAKQFGPQAKQSMVYLKGEQARQAVSKVKTRLKRTNVTLSSDIGATNRGGADWDLDETEVLITTDTLGNVNYTFRVIHPDANDNTFFNLVQTQKSGGTATTVKLFKYKMTTDFAEAFYNGEVTMRAFEGTITIDPLLDDGTGDGPTPPTPTEPEEEDDPCEDEVEIVVGGGNSGPITAGSGGGSNTTAPITLYDNNSPCMDIIEIPCNGGGGHLGNDPSCTGTFQGGTYIVNNCRQVVEDEEQTNTASFFRGPCMTGNIGILDPFTQNTCNMSTNVYNSYYSKFSPFKIDLESVRPDCNSGNPDPAKVKFMCVYNKLIQSETFKTLFLDMFQDSDILNVEFQISNTPLPTNAQGNCQLFENPDGTYKNIIKLDVNYLGEETSSIEIAKILLHECIHAYLNIKLKNCNLGPSLQDINNKDLGEIINLYYNNFQCAPNGESQHSFMFNYMLPTMKECLSQLKDLLISEEDQLYAESQNYAAQQTNYTVGNTPFNWDDFYYYFNLVGLHNSTEFQNEISPDPVKYYLFTRYYSQGNNMTKTCQ